VYDRFQDKLNSDPNGHGTHTASVAGGQLVGVARGATLHCMRVLDADGAGTYSDILDAMSWIQQRRAAARAREASRTLFLANSFNFKPIAVITSGRAG